MIQNCDFCLYSEWGFAMENILNDFETILNGVRT